MPRIRGNTTASDVICYSLLIAQHAMLSTVEDRHVYKSEPLLAQGLFSALHANKLILFFGTGHMGA